MKRVFINVPILIGILLMLQVVPVHAEDSGGWIPVAEGVDFQLFRLRDPNLVYVARMDRKNPDLILESSIGSGELVADREQVTEMAERYDDALNAWGGSWGMRNQVVVAINGDYFDPATGYPQNGMIHSGWYDKRYNQNEGWSGLVYGSDKNIFIGQCIANPLDRQYITFEDSNLTQRIDGLNTARGDNDLVLYTPDYAFTTKTDDKGVEVVLRVSQPVMIVPQPRASVGMVEQIRDHAGSTPIAFNQVILSASGRARENLLASIKVGDQIGISQEITSYDKDCETYMTTDWSAAYSGIGGAFTFLRDGEPQHLAVVGAVYRHPRTAIAYNDDYVYFIVVDGRSPRVSIGMSLDQLAVFAENELGAKWGIAQDGGGSSTMVINGKVVNHPSDLCTQLLGSEVQQAASKRAVGLGMVETPELYLPSATSHPCERPVANGMMMVHLLAQQNSNTFSPGDTLITPGPTKLRLGPGTNYFGLTVIPGNEQLRVLWQGEGLNGVEAKGANWWYVAYNGMKGWIPEANMLLNVNWPELRPRGVSPFYNLLP